jgi:hypothetical protein
MKIKLFFLLIILNNCIFSVENNQLPEKPFVIGGLGCQLGNNLFQIASISAYAWDNNFEPHFPDLATPLNEDMRINYEHVFFRCNATMPTSPIFYSWRPPKTSFFSYFPFPYCPNMSIKPSPFQSEKYFVHQRDRLLKLFAPRPDDMAYIKKKYPHILDHQLTVGVQIRWFGSEKDEPWHIYVVQYGADYIQKAISLFPEDSLFVISSNNLEFARKILPNLKNVIFLEDEPYYIDFFILSLCKHNIITNSTFGWWSAWLNQNPNKIVIATEHWLDPIHQEDTPMNDVWPENWFRLKAKWHKPRTLCDFFE